MKKLFVLFAVGLLVTGLAFAQDSNEYYSDEQSSGETTNAEPGSSGGTSPGNGNQARKIERFNSEIGIGFPVHWTNGLHDDAEDKTVTGQTSVGVGITFNFTRIIGLTLDADFSYSAKLSGISKPTSDYISLSGANVFLGPLFYLFNNDTFRVPLAAGIHLYYFSDDLWIPALDGSGGSWISRNDTQLGLGFSLGFQFHFESGVYLFSRTSVFLDFIRLHSAAGYDGASLTPYIEDICIDLPSPISWNVKPSLGIGIRF